MLIRRKAATVGAAILAGLLTALTASSQPVYSSLSQIPLSTPPNNVSYQALFMRYYQQEQFALHIDSSGKTGPDGKPVTGAAVRAMLMDEIGLTKAEDAALKALAMDYMAGFRAFMQQRGQLMNAQKAANTTGPDPVTAAKIAALVSQDQASIQNHIAQIQNALGVARFQVVDSYVHSTIASQIKYGAGTVKVQKQQ